MRKSYGAVLGVVAIVLIVILSFGWTAGAAQTSTAAPEGCILDVSGTLGIVICGGQIVDQLQLPTVTVKGPTITLPAPPPETIRPPAVRVTETVTVPGETRTVTAAPETNTVEIPGPTETVTITQPRPTQTVTASPEPRPTQTVTETPAGQEPVESVTVEGPEEDNAEPPALDLGDGETTVEEVGLGFISLVALLGIILFCMYLGWRIGRKGKEDEEADFFRDLLRNPVFYRSKH